MFKELKQKALNLKNDYVGPGTTGLLFVLVIAVLIQMIYIFSAAMVAIPIYLGWWAIATAFSLGGPSWLASWGVALFIVVLGSFWRRGSPNGQS